MVVDGETTWRQISQKNGPHNYTDNSTTPSLKVHVESVLSDAMRKWEPAGSLKAAKHPLARGPSDLLMSIDVDSDQVNVPTVNQATLDQYSASR